MSTNRENLDRLAADVAALEPADLAEVIDLVARLRAKPATGELTDPELTAELAAWGDDALAPDLEPFEWGPDGPPPIKPVRYEPGVGFVIVGGRDA